MLKIVCRSFSFIVILLFGWLVGLLITYIICFISTLKIIPINYWFWCNKWCVSILMCPHLFRSLSAYILCTFMELFSTLEFVFVAQFQFLMFTRSNEGDWIIPLFIFRFYLFLFFFFFICMPSKCSVQVSWLVFFLFNSKFNALILIVKWFTNRSFFSVFIEICIVNLFY